MRTQVETITPERAEALLLGAAGLPQRAITPRRVNAFASAMRRGQWQVTHQGIGIDPDGVLVDGQHRLSAVVLAGVPVEMLVVYDVPREAFAVLDTGTARSTAATLHIAGVTDPNVAAAAARMVLTYDQIGGTRKAAHSDIRSGFTSTDILNYMASERGRTLLGAIPAARAVVHSLNKFGMRSWFTAAIAIIDETNPDIQVRTEFVDKLTSGAMLPAQSPILTFRRWVISDTGYARVDRAYRGTVGIAGLIRTWNAYTSGNDLQLIKILPGRSIWPLPGRDVDEEAENDRLAKIAEREAERAAAAASDADDGEAA